MNARGAERRTESKPSARPVARIGLDREVLVRTFDLTLALGPEQILTFEPRERAHPRLKLPGAQIRIRGSELERDRVEREWKARDAVARAGPDLVREWIDAETAAE